LARVRDRVVGRLVAAKVAKTALPGINASRRRLELAPLDTMHQLLLRPPRVIYFTVRALEYPRLQWPQSYRFVGPGLWGPRDGEPEWLSAIERPIALVTCSTKRQNDQALLKSAVLGLPPQGLSVVGTSGATSPDEADLEQSRHVRVERFVPHDHVLSRAEVAVCHGGMGITQRALAHGVPVVVVPFGRDQFEVGRRIEKVGAGVMVSSKKLTPTRLAAAVRRARDLAPNAAYLAAAFRQAGGDHAAAGVVEQLLRDNSQSASADHRDNRSAESN
jgi:MGT family glycosyltransferase